MNLPNQPQPLLTEKTTLYVSEIDPKTTELQIKELFGQFGNCSITLLKDNYT
jgi:RNA recognition motif-containing protein